MIKSNKDLGYKQCSISVMDNISDPDITFDENGICNYYYDYKNAMNENVFLGEIGKNKLVEIVQRIKSEAKGKKYDCILGLSGGIDSTYLALIAKENGLKPLCVHFDYGWNSELAVQNIHETVNRLGFDLFTVVMNWPEFKDLLRSYFKAGVLDLDVPADHMIFGALYKIARKNKIKYLLSGNNIQTEFVLPKSWNYNKFDWANIKDIHRQFGTKKLKNLPRLSYFDIINNTYLKGIKREYLLNCIDYNVKEVKSRIESELGWKDYGGKHHESVFTRFYQGYILPNRFQIDKRKAHLSTLIFAGQLTKEEALKELAKPTYDINLQKDDLEYVAKKLDFTIEELNGLLKMPIKKHEEYKTDKKQVAQFLKVARVLKNIKKIF